MSEIESRAGDQLENENVRIPHEYLQAEDYYETRSVKAGRSQYICDFCGKSIGIGKPSDVHTFYPEFNGERTHKKCSDDFLNSLRTEEDGAPDYLYMQETITITKEDHTYLLERDEWLSCLEACGVDNWSGYEEAARLSIEQDEEIKRWRNNGSLEDKGWEEIK